MSQHRHIAPHAPARRAIRRATADRRTALGFLATLLVALTAAVAFAPAAAAKPFNDPWSSAKASPFQDVLIVHVGKARSLSMLRAVADVVVSDPETADVVLRTAHQPVLFGMKLGSANVLFFDAAGQQIRAVEVRVEYDVSALEHTIERQFPSAEVSVTSVLGELVLDGRANTSAEAAAIGELAERFVIASENSRSESGEKVDGAREDGELYGVTNNISVVDEEQIHLKVRVAEVNRGVLKRLGIDWNAGLQASTLSTTIGFTGPTLTGFLQNFDEVPLVSADDGAVLLDGSVQETAFVPRRPIQVGPETLDSFIKALEQYTLVRTLAEPSLTAVSGESASFLAGGEFPIPVGVDDNEITIEFKEFGIALDFTPLVVGPGRISLRVSTEVSDLTDEGAINLAGLVIPALSVRRANTTVELSSGGTIMMAGLIEQTTRRLSNGVPGLRNLPVLGQLFRSEEFQNSETELVILVTPYTVRQGAADDFVLPTDGFAPASDIDMYLFGRLHATYGAGPKSPDELRRAAEGVQAPIGFMME